MTDYQLIELDTPEKNILRITLNRPDKRNALSNLLRTELFEALECADRDDSVRVIILRGAGSCFSAGYDLTANLEADRPFYTAAGIGSWPRHVTEGSHRMWDLAKPVIAQVHGYCLAGGSELAASCDLVYVAEDARIGYPAVRAISPPDNQLFPWIVGMRRAMEMMLTGDAISGLEAVQYGFANRAYPEPVLEEQVLEQAKRVAQVPLDIQAMNKRAVHRQMEIMGIRAGVRAGTEMQALATFTKSTQDYIAEISKGLTAALSKRDGKFGDYRTEDESSEH